MKIAILSLMHGFNYGGMLQCYALSCVLRDLGHEVNVVDYDPNPNWRKLQCVLRPLGPLGRLAETAVRHRKYGRELCEKFDAFRRQRLPLSRRCCRLGELRDEAARYDAVLVGSDQVWNLDWYTPEYFLGFVPSGVRRISYAACCGIRKESYPSEVTAMLRRFDLLSVRNDMTAEFVKSRTGFEPPICCDPTLLADFSALTAPVDFAPGSYLLVYALSGSRFSENRERLAALRRQTNLPLVVIKSDVLQRFDCSIADHLVCNPTVETFVELFRRAGAVVTDSFHGSIFATLNHKPFVNYIGREASFERVSYIVRRYGLEKAYAADFALPELPYAAIDRKIAEHRDFSIQFLKDSL